MTIAPTLRARETKMPEECRCEVLDATTEGGGTDPRSCPVHAYEAGRRHERNVYLEERAELYRRLRSCTSLAYAAAAEVVANCFPTSDAVARLRSIAEDWKRTET
jgi:hypothetical protein